MTQIQAVNLPPKIFNLKGWLKQTDATRIKNLFNKLLVQSSFRVLNYSDHQFPLDGFTAFWLLAESHLAVHTFTDSGWSYIELSSCNREKALNFLTLCNLLDDQFKWENKVEELNGETLANT